VQSANRLHSREVEFSGHKGSTCLAMIIPSDQTTSPLHSADDSTSGANPTPPIFGSLIESSQSIALCASYPDLVEEPQELRARQLEELGYTTMAARVRACGWTAGGFRTCKQRVCPECSQRIAHKHAGQVVAAVAAMVHPVYALFTYRSKGVGAPALRSAVTSFRHGLRLLRERRFFACVRAGVGAIETSLSKDGTVWQVHSHMALDIQGGLDEAVLVAVWKKVTANRGEVQLHDAIYSPEGFATYTTKADTWCPPPGKTNPLHLLEVVMRGVHGRRLMIAWPRKKVGQAQ